jgi:hypothetical protein
MSGYRSLHREHILPQGDAIWNLAATPLLTTASAATNTNTIAWRLWVASSDGRLRTYRVEEPSLQEKAAALDASAARLQLTHVLVGDGDNQLDKGEDSHQDDMEGTDEEKIEKKISSVGLGCSRVSIVRNYTGTDDAAGDFLIMTLGLAGRVRLWKFAPDFDDNNPTQSQTTKSGPDTTESAAATTAGRPRSMRALHEFVVENATGTAAELCSPRIMSSGALSQGGSSSSAAKEGDVVVAVACLDGTVAIVATGFVTPAYTKDPAPAGSRLDTWGSRGSAIPLSICWQLNSSDSDPNTTSGTAGVLAVGRQDGVIDILTSSKQHQHRLARHTAPVRAVSFTDDAHLLVSGSDAGTILVWDMTRKVPALVHHVLDAHTSWILGLQVLPDSRRFVSCGADHKLHVWNVGQMHQAVHTFQTDFEAWALARGPSNARGNPRLVAGSDTGHVQVFSLEHS